MSLCASRLPVKVSTGSIVMLFLFYFTLLITTYWHVQGDLCYCGIKEGMSMIHIRGLHTHTPIHHWPKLWQATWVGDMISSMQPICVEGICRVSACCVELSSQCDCRSRCVVDEMRLWAEFWCARLTLKMGGGGRQNPSNRELLSLLEIQDR